MSVLSIRHDEERFRLASSDKFPKIFIPEECRNEECILGIDEAGRGPVLGPLVYASFLSPITQSKSSLKALGANDSKALSPEQREDFFVKCRETNLFGWYSIVLHPEYISNCMLSTDPQIYLNLNQISHNAVYEMIEYLVGVEGIKLKEVFVDTLGKAEVYQAKLSARFPTLTFTVSSKADSKYPVVGGASIIAKVLRDDILGRFMGIEASGYPGDSASIQWLMDNVNRFNGFPSAVRFSWSTTEQLMKKHCDEVAWRGVVDSDVKKPKSREKRPTFKLIDVTSPFQMTSLITSLSTTSLF